MRPARLRSSPQDLSRGKERKKKEEKERWFLRVSIHIDEEREKRGRVGILSASRMSDPSQNSSAPSVTKKRKKKKEKKAEMRWAPRSGE